MDQMDGMDPNVLLATFLRKLADSIDEKKLTDQQLCRIGEFFMSFIFKEKMKEDKHKEDDFLKFITLGWWVYTQILPELD